MAKNEHAAALAKSKQGMKYRVSAAGKAASLANLAKAREVKKAKREGLK